MQQSVLVCSEKKCSVPPISTLLNPVSVSSTPGPLQLSGTPPLVHLNSPQVLECTTFTVAHSVLFALTFAQSCTTFAVFSSTQEVHTTVLPPLETVIRDEHKRALFTLPHHVPQAAQTGMRTDRSMPDIIRTHTCHKCHRIECSCDQDMPSLGVSVLWEAAIPHRCLKAF